MAGDGTSVHRIRWTRGGRTRAELWTVEGGGHTWPGARGAAPEAGPVSGEFEASEEVVRFLLSR